MLAVHLQAPYGSGAPHEWEEDDGTVTSLAVNKSPLSLNQTPRTRQMDTPSSSGHATARGMAKIMGVMGNLGELDGGKKSDHIYSTPTSVLYVYIGVYDRSTHMQSALLLISRSFSIKLRFMIFF